MPSPAASVEDLGAEEVEVEPEDLGEGSPA